MNRHTLIFAGVLLLILGASCGHEQLPTNSTSAFSQAVRIGSDDSSQSLEIISAKLNFFVVVPNGQPVYLHRIEEAWDPATVSWNTFAGAYSLDVEGSVTVAAGGWHSADITGLVQGWAMDSVSNHGVLLEQSAPAGAPVAMHSSEKVGFSPFIEICYATMGSMICDTVMPSGDAFIDQALPDASTGSNQILLLGKMMMPNAEKQALLQFEMPDIVYDVEYSSINGVVWEDDDQDGILDPGETGISGIRVNLYDCQDVLLDSTLSNQSGSYKYDSLLAGDFVVEFMAPSGYFFSPQDQGPSDVIDSDVDPSTGRTECFALGEGEDALNWSAGLYAAVLIDSGCTRPLAYWKRLVGGLQVSNISSLLPIWLGANIGSSSICVEDAGDVFDVLRMRTYGSPWNGITRLYAQLLVTKLNIASGAIPDDIAVAISEADAFLGLNSWTTWRSLSWRQKRIVLKWVWEFRKYNNGVIGPGRCGHAGNSLGDRDSR
ncbi:MAG: SdrD B-like domain-containing protein [Candidatus Zixiibacteriota bacterium]